MLLAKLGACGENGCGFDEKYNQSILVSIITTTAGPYPQLSHGGCRMVVTEF